MRKFALYLIVVLACATVQAQDVVVTAKADSTMMWVGQQTGLHLEVTCNSDQTVVFPSYRDTIVWGLEIIPPVIADTQYVNNGKRMTVTRKYTVTCFDSAFIYVPPFTVSVDGKDYESESLALAFMTYEISPEDEQRIFGPKDNLKTPVRFYEAKSTIIYWIVALIAIAVAVYLFVRYRDDKPIIRRIKVEPKLPAHIVALNAMEKLRESGSSHDDDAKHYYTCLTDIIREYINGRYGFNATEMTSCEILEKLEESNDRESLRELKELLETSDMVKFAKFKPMLGENDQNLVSALEFINQTKIDVPEQELQSRIEETVVEEKRSKEARMAILIAAVVVSVCGAAMLVLAIMNLYYLIF